MMIRAYKPGNRNFDYNGGYNLKPITCESKMKLKGGWVVTLRNPLDRNIEGTVEDAILHMDTPIGERQLPMINEVDKNDDFIEAYAIPILLTNDICFFDICAVNKTAQDALNITSKDTKYRGYSDISKMNSAYHQEMCANEAISGDNDNAFLDRWGGEPIYKNYRIYLNKRAGADSGMRVEPGFNLTGAEERIDISEVVTRVHPKAYNGHMLPSNETVDSSNIEKYRPRRFPSVVFGYIDIKLRESTQEGDEENGITIYDTKAILYQELRERTEREYTTNEADAPIITYNVQMVDLPKMNLYKEYSELMRVSLKDTVHVSHRGSRIEMVSRVIELIYDEITSSITSLTLGNHKEDYFDRLSKTQHIIDTIHDKVSNTIMAWRIVGVVNLMMTSLKAQKDTAKRQDVYAILFEDIDKSSPTYGALCIDTRGIQIVKKRNEADTDRK